MREALKQPAAANTTNPSPERKRAIVGDMIAYCPVLFTQNRVRAHPSSIIMMPKKRHYPYYLPATKILLNNHLGIMRATIF